jgi:hypothetical protein
LALFIHEQLSSKTEKRKRDDTNDVVLNNADVNRKRSKQNNESNVDSKLMKQSMCRNWLKKTFFEMSEQCTSKNCKQNHFLPLRAEDLFTDISFKSLSKAMRKYLFQNFYKNYGLKSSNKGKYAFNHILSKNDHAEITSHTRNAHCKAKSSRGNKTKILSRFIIVYNCLWRIGKYKLLF